MKSPKDVDRKSDPFAAIYVRLIIGVCAVCAAFVVVAVCLDCKNAVSAPRTALCIAAAAIAIFVLLEVVRRTIGRGRKGRK